MTNRLIHRGPDQEGFLVRPEVALGSRRLKIIDLVSGRMPVSNEDGSVHVVYNGEIYNHRVLRSELSRRGHRFSSTSDTEVLVHLYEEEGIGFVDRLIGMFAFALWDEEKNCLFLVRDRLGIKPLHYSVTESELAFASELGALAVGSRHHDDLDLRALTDFLALGYVRAPRTIYKTCRKLPPGCILRSQGGNVDVRRYWEFPRATSGSDAPSSVGTALEELDTLLRTAVHDRLVADVPLGAFLSGGVDSGLVVAYAAERASGPLSTFSVGFEGKNELPYARQLANRYGTAHHELVLSAQDCRVLDQLVEAFDEPFGDPSAIPTYFVSRLARTKVTVSLSGDGGDELFAGYDRYVRDARWSWVEAIPRAIRAVTLGVPAALLPRGAYGVVGLAALSASRDDRYAFLLAEELSPRRGGLLNPDRFGSIPPRRKLLREEFQSAEGLPYPGRLQHVDAISYLPDNILVKVDRMSMAHSLEARVPLLDHRIVEFSSRLPPQWRIKDGQGKWLLKRLAERYLPRDTIYRPKQGFSLPISEWMRQDVHEFAGDVLDTGAHVRPYLHMPSVKRLVHEHRVGRRDHSGTLWRLLMLERWFGHRSGSSQAGRSPQPTPRPAVADVLR